MLRNLQFEEVYSLPRFNYRVITDTDKKELVAFGRRLVNEGQLTAIRVAVFDEEALKDEQVQQLCGDGARLLIDGERRLVAISTLEEKDQKMHFPTVSVELIPIASFKEYLALQLTYNMDRKQTSFIEDGFGFKRFLENGGTKTTLLNCINFPPEVLSNKAKMKYITERIELTALHPSLYPHINSGLLKTYKSKPHQGYLVLGYSEYHQMALAEEFNEAPNPKSDDGILGFFRKFRTRFTSPPFDTEDASLGIEALGTGACVSCIHHRVEEEEQWGFGNDNKKEFVPYCYLSECFEQKSKNHIDGLISSLIEAKTPFVILGAREKNYSNYPAEEPLENGFTKIRYYQLVEAGSCTHAIAGIADRDAGDTPQGQIVHVCPEKSGCVIHHPKKVAEKKTGRNIRLVSEKSKVEKQTRQEVAMEWVKRLLESDYSRIKEELFKWYIIASFEYFFRGIDSEKQNAFLELIGSTQERPFKAWGEATLKDTFTRFDMDKSWIALLMAHRIFDINPSWEWFKTMGKQAGVDFEEALKKALEANLKGLEEKHDKRKAGWDKEQELLEKKIHALYFHLPIFIGITSWKDEQSILSLLENEILGKKACRLIGVTLGKEDEYMPSQILEKLKGRKAELETHFPKYKLGKKDKELLEVFLTIPENPLPKLLPERIQFGSGQVNDFVKASIEKAGRDDLQLPLAELLTAVIKKNKLVFHLLDNSTRSLLTKVIKEQKLTGYYTFDKNKKTYTFLESK